MQTLADVLRLLGVWRNYLCQFRCHAWTDAKLILHRVFLYQFAMTLRLHVCKYICVCVCAQQSQANEHRIIFVMPEQFIRIQMQNPYSLQRINIIQIDNRQNSNATTCLTSIPSHKRFPPRYALTLHVSASV